MIRGPKTTSTEASAICQELGASLIVVESQEQNEYLTGKVGLDEMKLIALGCTDADASGLWECYGKNSSTWYWLNQKLFNGYWNWAENEPSSPGGSPSCLLLNDAGEWQDAFCTSPRDLVVACTQAISSEPVRCPMSWEPIDNKCVYIVDNVLGSPEEASNICHLLSGSLIIIDNEVQNTNLTQKLLELNGNVTLLGCSDRQLEGHWVCDDGPGRSPYLVFWTEDSQDGYWNWGDIEPVLNDNATSYVYLTTNGDWTSSESHDVTTVMMCESPPIHDVYCPAPFEPWEDKCLYLGTINVDYEDALRNCQRGDGTGLVVLETKGQNLFMQYEVQKRGLVGMLMGCDDIDNDGTWTCIGKNPETFYWRNETDNAGYWNWRSDLPTSEDCVAMDGSGFYVSLKCKQERKVMLACTAEPVEQPTTSIPTITTESTKDMTSRASVTEKYTSEGKTSTLPTDGYTTEGETSALPTDENTTEEILSIGAIVGIVFACLFAVLIVFILLYVWRYPDFMCGKLTSKFGGNSGRRVYTFEFENTSSEAHLIETDS